MKKVAAESEDSAAVCLYCIVLLPDKSVSYITVVIVSRFFVFIERDGIGGREKKRTGEFFRHFLPFKKLFNRASQHL